jgi:glycosyltransferase involved in cell wall biosynthesis
MILLVTCFPWDSVQGGAFILRHWVKRLDAEPIHWVALGRPAGQVPFQAAHVRCEFRTPPARGNVRLRLDPFWRWYQRRIWAGQTAALLARRIKELKPRVIWLMADFGLAPVGLRLLPALRGQRVHVSLHDDLPTTAQRERCSPAFLAEIREFTSGLQSLDVSADAVSEELLADTVPQAKRTAIVTLPVDSGKCAPNFVGPRLQGPLTIGFSGNFYGEKEVACFVEGLQAWSRQSGRDWRLRVFGAEKMGSLDRRIEARGFTAPEVVRAALADCDLLLLPSPLNRPEMRTNMPTKLVSYLELGRMVFGFAPENSATKRVVEDSHLGPVISICDSALVAKRLDELLGWDIQAAQTGWRRLVEDRFSERRIMDDLKVLLAGKMAQKTNP